MVRRPSDTWIPAISKINCHLFRHPGSDAVRSDDFKGQVAQLDEEFKDGLKEFIPFVANDDTDNSSDVPTLKISPLKQVLTVDDFMDQVSPQTARFQMIVRGATIHGP